MIVMVTGSPGAGKSYALVKEIVTGIEKGECVATNIPLVADWAWQLCRSNPFRALRGRRWCQQWARSAEARLFFSEDLATLLRVRVRGSREGRARLVLDEVHRWANSRTWDSEAHSHEIAGAAKKRSARDIGVERRLTLVKWFSGHRHYGWDVYLGTQTESSVDAQIRNLAEYYIICRNLRRFRFLGIPISPFNLFLRLWTWNDRSRTIVRRQLYPLKRRIARLYATHALATVDAPADTIWLPLEDGGAERAEPGGRPPAGGPPAAAPPSDPQQPEDAGDTPCWVIE